MSKGLGIQRDLAYIRNRSKLAQRKNKVSFMVMLGPEVTVYSGGQSKECGFYPKDNRQPLEGFKEEW